MSRTWKSRTPRWTSLAWLSRQPSCRPLWLACESSPARYRPFELGSNHTQLSFRSRRVLDELLDAYLVLQGACLHARVQILEASSAHRMAVVQADAAWSLVSGTGQS